MDQTIALALRAVRHPETGLAALLAVLTPGLGGRTSAIYLAPAGPEPAELLAAGGAEAARLGPPGPLNAAASEFVRRLVMDTTPVSELTPPDVPAPWKDLACLSRLGAPLPSGAGCLLVVGGDSLVDLDALRSASSPAALLVAALVATREAERLRRELHELRQSRSLLAAGLQHDLRTPITSILGSARTLRDRADHLLPEERTELLEIVASQAERMNTMVGEALAVHTVDPDAPVRAVPVDVRELARRVASAAKAARSGEVAIDVEDAQLVTDPARLERALLNLLDNALKYAPPDRPVHLAGERVDDGYNLTVADAGPGVNAALVPSLFSAYATDPDRADGTGLGLHSVAALAADLGGRVCYGRREGWTRFTVTVPDGLERAAVDVAARGVSA